MSNHLDGDINPDYDVFAHVDDNLGVIRQDIDNVEECVEDVRHVVEDVRDGLGIFKSVRIKAASVENILNGLEKAAGVAKKIGSISKPAQALENVFDQMGNVAKTIKNNAQTVENNVEPVRDNLLTLKNKMIDAEDALDDASVEVGEFQTTISEVDESINKMETFDGAGGTLSQAVVDTINDAGADMRARLDDTAAPANEVMFEIDAVHDTILGQGSLLADAKDLYANIPALGALGAIESLDADLDKILDIVGVLEAPLAKLEAALDEVEWALDAAQSVYDSVVAPVIDPIIEATGIQKLIDDITAELTALLPDADILDDYLNIHTDIEAYLPNITAGSFSAPALLDLSFGLGNMFEAFIIPGVPTGFNPVDFASFGDTTLGELPFSYSGVTLPAGWDPVFFSYDDNGNTLSISSIKDGIALIGNGGADTLTAARDNGEADVLFGGAGNDILQTSSTGTSNANTPYDVFVGGEGDDTLKARSKIIVQYNSFISDYKFTETSAFNGTSGELLIEHLNITDGRDEGTDTVEYNVNTILAFDGFSVDAVTFVNGLQNLPTDDLPFAHWPTTDPDGNAWPSDVIRWMTLLGRTDMDNPAFVADPAVTRDGYLDYGVAGQGNSIRDFLFGRVDGNGFDDYDEAFYGFGGDDLLVGRGGDDRLDGGAGNDYLDGGTGSDRINGGSGIDVADFRSEDSGFQLFMDRNQNNDGGFNTVEVRVQNVERVIGTTSGDDIFGGLGTSNIIEGGDGADTLRSSGGTDNVLKGENGKDVLVLDTGTDTGLGGTDNDIIYVSLDPDDTTGLGVNTIDGGDDTDVLTYRNASDNFTFFHTTLSLQSRYKEVIFDTSSTSHTLLDPNHAQYEIRFDLSVENGATVGGYIHLDVATQTVTRYDSGDNVTGTDVFKNIEVFDASINDDTIHLSSATGELVGVNASRGNDTFTSDRAVEAISGRTDKSEQPELEGGDDNDLFQLSDAFSIDGNNGTDTLDVSHVDRAHWYIDAFHGSIGWAPFFTLEAGDADIPTLPDPGEYTSSNSAAFHALTGYAAAQTIANVEVIKTGDLRDIVYGDNQVTEIRTFGGNDYIKVRQNTAIDETKTFGGDGDDHIIGGNQRDVVKAGAGNDLIDLTEGVTGTKTTDYAEGGAGNDVFWTANIASGKFLKIWGGNDDDSDETFDALDENGDMVTRKYQDIVDLRGGENNGSPPVNGSNYTVDLSNSNNNSGGAAGFELNGIEHLFGANGDDNLTGDSGDNMLFGRNGEDQLSGQDGNDILIGGKALDKLYGGVGNDLIYGGTQPLGDDGSNNGADNDHWDKERVFGGGGRDTLTFAASRPVGGLSDESLVPIDGSLGSVTIDMDANITHSGSFFNGEAVFVVDGGNPNDKDDVIKTLFAGIEVVVGTANDDVIKGDSDGDDELIGGEGADEIRGRGGNDKLDGGRGDDEVHGGNGNDLIFGSIGGADETDNYLAGSGTDTLNYSAAADGVTFDDTDVTETLLDGSTVVTFDGSASTKFTDLNVTWQGGGTAPRAVSGGFDSPRPMDIYRTANPVFAKRYEHIDAGFRAIVLESDDVTPASGFEIDISEGTSNATGNFKDFEIYIGSKHDDIFKFSEGGTYEIDLGAGSDTLEWNFGSTINLTVDLGQMTQQTVATGLGSPNNLNLTLSKVEDIGANPGDDVFTGNAVSNDIRGGSGEDVIDGKQGDDELHGNSGVDEIRGGAGNDLIFGGSQSDTAIYDGPAFNDIDVRYAAGELANGDIIISDRWRTDSDDGTDLLNSVGTYRFNGTDVAKANLQTYDIIGEWNTVAVNSDVQTITLNHAFINPVVIAGMSTFNEDDFAQVRIENLSTAGGSTSFDISIDETTHTDGIHVDEFVTYLVVEEGRHVLDDGTVIEAGKVNTDKVYTSALDEGQEMVAFSAPITNAVVFSNTNTGNGTNWVASRNDDVSNTGFDVALIEQESDGLGHTTETIGWIATSAGNAFDFTVGEVSADENAATSTFRPAIAAIQDINETDPAVPRIDGFEVFLTEDQSKDAETGHGVEDIGLISFSGRFGFLMTPNLQATDDTASTAQNTLVSIDVLANDVDPDTGGTKAIQQILGVTNGTAVINNGKIDFTPGNNFSGQALIGYLMTDSRGEFASADVTVTVNDVTPPLLSVPDLVDGSDTGASNSDDLTSDVTPTIQFTTEAGATVEVDWGDGNGFQVASAGTGALQQETLGVSMGNAYGSDGIKTVTVRSTDSAGNAAEETLDITIDTVDPLFSLNVSHRDSVDDASNASLNLDGAFGAASAEVGGNNYVFVAGKDDSGVSVFSVASNGTLTNVDNVSEADNPANELLGARALAAADVGGVIYLFVAAREDDGISVFSVDVNGQLTLTDNIDDSSDAALELDQVGDLATAVVGGSTYLFGASQADSGIAAFRVDPGGLLVSVDQISDDATLELNGARSVATASAGGTDFLIATGNVDDGVSVFSIANDGTLTNTDNVDDGDDPATILNGAYDVATARVSNTTYVVVASQVGNGISVFSLSGTGLLTNVFNLPDDAALELDDVRALSTAQIGNSTYLFAGGTDDDGISIFKIKANGTLEFKEDLEDDGTLELDGVQGLHVAAVNGKSFLVGAGAIDDGVSVFNVPAAVDLKASSDSGVFNGDDLTNDTTPTIQFTVESGSTVTIDWDDGNGFQSVADGNGALQQHTLGTAYGSDGTKTIKVRGLDDAGNQITESIDITVDTQADLSGINLAGGASASAGNNGPVTSAAPLAIPLLPPIVIPPSINFTPTIEFIAEAGAAVSVDWDDGNGFNSIGDGTGATQQTTLASLYGSDGIKTIQVKVEDLAGNTTTKTLAIQIDTQANLSAINLTNASDTGSDNADNITSDATPEIKFTAEALSLVLIDWDDGNGFVPAAIGTGAAQKETLASPYGSDGVKTIQAQVTDLLGNTVTNTLDITVDTTDPALSAVDLTDASDEGPSSTDDVTGDITPTIVFIAESGATVEIDWDNGNGFVPATGNGTDAPQPETLAAAYTANGTKTIGVQATDLAGNSSVQTLSIEVVGIGDDIFVGSSAADAYYGYTGNDKFTLRYGNDTATGGSGSDEFIVDGRYINTGDVHTITDLNFGEGDSLQFRLFDANSFDDQTIPSNTLAVAGNGRTATFDSVEDIVEAHVHGVLQATDDGGGDTKLTIAAAGEPVSVVLEGLAFSSLSIPAGPMPDLSPTDDTIIGTSASEMMMGYGGDDSILVRFGNDTAIGGADADRFIIDGRYVNDGDSHRVTDLNFAEGDTLLMRFLDPGTFDNTADPANALSVANSGGTATFDSVEDILEANANGVMNAASDGFGGTVLSGTVGGNMFTLTLDGIDVI